MPYTVKLVNNNETIWEWGFVSDNTIRILETFLETDIVNTNGTLVFDSVNTYSFVLSEIQRDPTGYGFTLDPGAAYDAKSFLESLLTNIQTNPESKIFYFPV